MNGTILNVKQQTRFQSIFKCFSSLNWKSLNRDKRRSKATPDQQLSILLLSLMIVLIPDQCLSIDKIPYPTFKTKQERNIQKLIKAYERHAQ